MRFTYRHIELVDFIIFCCIGDDMSDFRAVHPEKFTNCSLTNFYFSSEHHEIVKEFFY